MKKVKLGVVGVDSGQLMVCDPCYINSEWNSEEEFLDIRRYKDSVTNAVFQYRVDFENFESSMKEYDGKTPNQLIKDGVWEEQEVPEKIAKIGNFSYAGICETTLQKNEKQGGQLNYKLGHSGAGVAFKSGMGDGLYDVFAYIEEFPMWGERIVKVEIILVND